MTKREVLFYAMVDVLGVNPFDIADWMEENLDNSPAGKEKLSDLLSCPPIQRKMREVKQGL